MPSKAGIQNYLKTLDSRLRGNDIKIGFKTFYETIKHTASSSAAAIRIIGCRPSLTFFSVCKIASCKPCYIKILAHFLTLSYNPHTEFLFPITYRLSHLFGRVKLKYIINTISYLTLINRWFYKIGWIYKTDLICFRKKNWKWKSNSPRKTESL